MVNKNFAVLGLGRFGRHVALTLHDMGCDVLCVDKDENIVAGIADVLPQAMIFDIRDARAMREAGIANCDTVIIASKNLEASLMATMLCKEMNVNEIIVKAIDERHAKMAQQLGAMKIIFSERDTARSLALSLVSPNVVDRIDIDVNINILRMTVPKEFVGKNLIESDLRNSFDVNIIAIITADETLIPPPPTRIFTATDTVFIIGTPTALANFEQNFTAQ